MEGKKPMYTWKTALSLARQARGCPPYAIRKDPSQADRVKQHLSICPHCREGSMEEVDAFEGLAQKIVSMHDRAGIGSEKPASPGQIRCLCAHPGCWRDGFYYTPPMVLVLRQIGGIADEIRVAQLYDDPILAGPGDLILDEDRTGGAGELFVECWNTYTFRAGRLGSLVGEAPPEVVAAVEAMADNPDAAPPWAPLLLPLKPDDPREHFRQLEVEAAYTFASLAAGELMDELRKSGLGPVRPTPRALRAAIEARVPGVSFPEAARTTEDFLAAAEFPPELWKWAAADSESRKTTGGVVVFREGELDSFGSMQVDIFPEDISDEGLLVLGGRFPVDPKMGSPVEAFFRYIDEDGSLLEPESVSVDRAKGYFLVKFDAVSREWKNLRMAVVYEPG